MATGGPNIDPVLSKFNVQYAPVVYIVNLILSLHFCQDLLDGFTERSCSGATLIAWSLKFIYTMFHNSVTFFYSLFKVAVSDARYTATIGSVILKQINCTEYGPKRSWPSSGKYSGIFLQGTD